MNDTTGVDERDSSVADAVIVFTIDNVISFETDCCMEGEDERETERDVEVVCEQTDESDCFMDGEDEREPQEELEPD